MWQEEGAAATAAEEPREEEPTEPVGSTETRERNRMNLKAVLMQSLQYVGLKRKGKQAFFQSYRIETEK